METDGSVVPRDGWPAAAAERHLALGEVLVREGEAGDEAYLVISGALEILRGPEALQMAVAGPGATIGEVAMLAGCPRTGTVRALEPSVVRPIGRASYEQWLHEDDDRWVTIADVARERIDHHRLLTMIVDLLAVDTVTAADIAASSRWEHLVAGGELFARGDPSDAAFLVVSGRLAVVDGDRLLREVARGQLVGEIGLIERAPRSASVIAMRDTTLARFDVEAFRALTATHPALMLQVSRTVLARLGRPNASSDRARSIAISVTAPLDTRLFTSRVVDELVRHGTTQHLWSARVDAVLGRPGLVESGLSVTRPAVAELLQEAETTNDYLVLETDATDSNWTRTALAHADRIVVVASADPDATESARIDAVLRAAPPSSRIERWLAAVQRADAERPAAASVVADRFGFDRVAHVRSTSAADLARLARLVSGNATGLALGGGGARGFAHIGAWRAMRELGIDIDVVGGASIGAPIGMMVAQQIEADELVRMTTELFRGLLDYTVPVVSLLKGERIAANISRTLGDMDLRDTWLPFSCVSTNLTRSRVEVHDRGHAATAVRASVAIPGVLPPVPYGGDLLVDGGVLNNLPCDVVRATGTVDRLIAVDLSPPVGPTARDDYGLSVSGWKALRSRFGSDRSTFPGIVAVIMRAMVAGSVRDRDRLLADGTVDLYLDLDLRGVQLLDFERVAEISARGYEAARPRLSEWSAADAGDGATRRHRVAADPA